MRRPSLDHGIAVLVLASAALVSLPASAQGWRPITEAREFLDLVADRPLTAVSGGDSYVSAGDGTVIGRVGGKPYAGRWTWRSGQACYVGRVEGEAPFEACANISIQSDQVRFAWVNWETFDYRIGD